MTNQQQKNLSLYPVDYPFETLKSRVKEGKTLLNPEFQRKFVWDENKEKRETGSRFIESCLMRIPLPVCYFYENKENKQEVIDGVQRITTICDFLSDKFSLFNLETYQEYNGKKFSELPQQAQSDIENYTLRCIILRNENDPLIVQDIFQRLNRGSVTLAPQEIRHALYPGSLDKLLTELGDNNLVQILIPKKDKKNEIDRRSDEEIVLRYFAIDDELKGYGDKLSKYLDLYMKNNQNMEYQKLEDLKTEFLDTLEKCQEVFDEDIFKNLNTKQKNSDERIVGRTGVVHFELQMWGLKRLEWEFIKSNKQSIYDNYKTLCGSLEFINAVRGGGLQQKNSILNRRALWQEKVVIPILQIN